MVKIRVETALSHLWVPEVALITYWGILVQESKFLIHLITPPLVLTWHVPYVLISFPATNISKDCSSSVGGNHSKPIGAIQIMWLKKPSGFPRSHSSRNFGNSTFRLLPWKKMSSILNSVETTKLKILKVSGSREIQGLILLLSTDWAYSSRTLWDQD